MSETKPIRLLIAALGGEGGGVLAGWISNAAIASGHFGSALRFRASHNAPAPRPTISEILPRKKGAKDKRPVLALNAAPGEVDVMVASELLGSRACNPGRIRERGEDLTDCLHRACLHGGRRVRDGRRSA